MYLYFILIIFFSPPPSTAGHGASAVNFGLIQRGLREDGREADRIQIFRPELSLKISPI